MNSELVQQITACLAAGRGEVWAGVAVVPLLELESGTRFGLDAEGRWLALTAGRPDPDVFAPGSERHFVELLETPRADVESGLEERARALGLSPDAVVFSVPSIELVRTVLVARAAHFTRLGLLWLLPSELRALRTEIASVARDSRLSRVIKDIAQHLIVPE